MIGFACAIEVPEYYRRHAGPSISLVAEADSVVFPQAAPRSLAHVYNLILDQAAALDDLEALVIVDEEAELLDTGLCAKLRNAFADPSVAIVGCAGAAGVRSIAWWEGEAAWSSSRYRPRELDGAEFPGLIADGWTSTESTSVSTAREADAVDSVLMCLSPWAVHNIRFDEGLGPRYGYDVDYCLQVRAAGRRVLVQDVAVAHYRPLGVITDPDTWAEAHMRAARKWEGKLPGVGADMRDWKTRARYAEAEAAAARLLSATKMYEAQAQAWRHEREMTEATGSLSWRITAPLRHAGIAARRLRALRRGGSSGGDRS